MAIQDANGPLTLGNATGITIESGADGSAAMTISGTATAINSALNNLSYSADSEEDDSLDLTLDDPASIASGGANQDRGGVAISLLGPSLNVPGAQTTSVNTALVFSQENENAIVVGDAGPSDTQLTVGLSVASGALTLATEDGLEITAGPYGATAMTIRGIAADINTAARRSVYAPCNRRRRQ